MLQNATAVWRQRFGVSPLFRRRNPCLLSSSLFGTQSVRAHGFFLSWSASFILLANDWVTLWSFCVVAHSYARASFWDLTHSLSLPGATAALRTFSPHYSSSSAKSLLHFAQNIHDTSFKSLAHAPCETSQRSGCTCSKGVSHSHTWQTRRLINGLHSSRRRLFILIEFSFTAMLTTRWRGIHTFNWFPSDCSHGKIDYGKFIQCWQVDFN